MAKKSRVTKILSEKQLAKKYPGSGRAIEIALSDEHIIRLPTRCVPLNYQLNGGIIYGKIIEIFGEESTGKTLLAQDFGYCCQSLGGEIIWADAENSFNTAWATKNGLDPNTIHLMEDCAMENISDWVQDTIISIRARLIKNEPILLILDSLAAIRCIEEIGESQLDARAKFGNRAKAISDFLGNRNKLFAKMGVCVILINQLRRKIGATQFEDPDKTPGGDATKFYAAQRLGLVRGKQIKKKINGIEVKVGQNVYLRTKKDKTGPPRSTTPAQVYFRSTKTNGVGFDKYFGLPELLVQLKVIERKKGASRYYMDGEVIANGEDAFMELLASNEELRKKLIHKSGINTISRVRSKLDNISTNLYPVNIKGDKSEEDITEE